MTCRAGRFIRFHIADIDHRQITAHVAPIPATEIPSINWHGAGDSYSVLPLNPQC